MNAQLSKWNDATAFHMGLQRLGDCIGAETIGCTEDGAPDVVWLLDKRGYTFEAKASKKLSKKYVLQARAHPDWVTNKRPETARLNWQRLVASPSRQIDDLAIPYAGGLNFVSVDEVIALGTRVGTTLKKLRTKFVGKEFGDARRQFKLDLQSAALDWTSIDLALSSPLVP